MIVYEDLLSLEKLYDVYKNICLTTKHQRKLLRFELSFSCNMIHILDILKKEQYHHGRYCLFLISFPKYRLIMSENIEDKIINHLVSKYILLPALSPKLIEMNVATRVDKGTKAALYYLKKYINRLKENYDKIYVLKCDIRKYFYNIDHRILLEKLKRDIEDPRIHHLLEEIISSTDASYINQQIEQLIKKELERVNKSKVSNARDIKEKLYQIPFYRKGKGLPIGNETSQILAIYYLNELDHYIKEVLHIKCYIRYMDDFILLHPDRAYLQYCFKQIHLKVKELKLELNHKTQIYDLSHGLNFLGYRFLLKGKKTIVLINNQTKKRVKRKLKRMRKKQSMSYPQVVASYYGYFKQADVNYFMFKNKIALKK